nr:type 4a pilus biogenesis protein PilO [Dissulfurirhabdus thermomarina]
MPNLYKVGILLAAWVVPLAAFWLLYLNGTLKEIDGLKDEIPKLRQEIADLQEKERHLPEVEAEVKAMEGLLATAMKLLPEQKDIPSVLTEISSLGNEARLEFQSFQPQQEVKKGFYAEIPVSLRFRGPFFNTLAFFDRVARMARIVHIRELRMGGAAPSSEIWSLTGEGGPMKGGRKAGGRAAPAAGAPGAPGAPGGATGGGAGEDAGVQRGATWVLNTSCQAVTYRFLSPQEQAAAAKARRGRRGRRRR